MLITEDENITGETNTIMKIVIQLQKCSTKRKRHNDTVKEYARVPEHEKRTQQSSSSFEMHAL